MWRKDLCLCLFLALTFAGRGMAAGERNETDDLLVVTEGFLNKASSVAVTCAERADGMNEIIIAQIPEPEPGPPGPPGTKGMDAEMLRQWKAHRAEREQNLQMLQLWKIMQEVELRDRQLDSFFPLMREMQKTEHQLAEKRHDLAKALRQELRKDSPDKEQLEKLSTQLLENSGRIWQAKRDGMEKVMSILDPAQKARFMLAISGMERDVWEAIAQVRMIDPMLPKANIDREKFESNMKALQQRMEKIRQELREKGYPVDDNKARN